MICLDTNAVIGAMNIRAGAFRTHLETALAERVSVGLPVIALHELWYGIKKSGRPRENGAALREFLSFNIALWDFDADDAQEAGDIRAALARAGTPIGPYDVLIAAQARRRGATLVTANKREFSRVPGLMTEDWAE